MSKAQEIRDLLRLPIQLGEVARRANVSYQYARNVREQSLNQAVSTNNHGDNQSPTEVDDYSLLLPTREIGLYEDVPLWNRR